MFHGNARLQSNCDRAFASAFLQPQSHKHTQSNTQWLDRSDSEWVWEGDKHPISHTFSGGMLPPPSLPQTTSGTAINHISPGSRCGWVVERSTGPWDSRQTLDGKRWCPGTRLNNTNICVTWLLYTNYVSAEIRGMGNWMNYNSVIICSSSCHSKQKRFLLFTAPKCGCHSVDL